MKVVIFIPFWEAGCTLAVFQLIGENSFAVSSLKQTGQNWGKFMTIFLKSFEVVISSNPEDLFVMSAYYKQHHLSRLFDGQQGLFE